MCGICGYITDEYTGEIDVTSILNNMKSALAHRGPDDSALWFSPDKKCGFGHTRLSIIDLSGGRQPLVSRKGNVIVYNGELYNFEELKSQIGDSYIFETNSDTEVILAAYEKWGVKCLNRFRGMFAFCIYDYEAQEIFLARDHFGIKPLVYSRNRSSIVFSSELQSLVSHPFVEKQINYQAIDHYLWLQYIPAPHTIYKGVYKLPPAHYLKVSLDGSKFSQVKYWEPEFKPDYSKSTAEWLEETEYVIKDSVQKHLVADVKFGAFLSGGIDSSLVVDYMSQILEQPVRTFTIGYENEGYDEREYAKIVSDKCKSDHYIDIVKPDILDLLPTLVRHYGEPFGDSSAVAAYYVSRLARKHVPMVLSGDGGDEMFAGYKSHVAWAAQTEKPMGIQIIKRAIQKMLSLATGGNSDDRGGLTGWMRYNQYLPKEQRLQLWRLDYRELVDKSIREYQDLFDTAPSHCPIHKVQYMDIKTYLSFDNLSKVDIASMAHGLEVRTPFVDREVFEFVSTIPGHVNLSKIGNRFVGKQLLKGVLEAKYGHRFVHRVKRGFAIPLKTWFAPGGELYGELQRRLLDNNSALTEMFNREIIAELLEKGMVRPLWTLLFLDEWLNQHKGA